jgi:TolB-like protein/DNA-binding winged helix-turn-helix (wHTH) protein/Tfp pilus assembly protein PilF
MTESSRVQFGVYEVDLRAGELRKHGLRVKLQTQPFGILSLLLERPGEIVSREELRQKLWPTDVFVDFDQGLNKAINKLRDALGDSAENPRFIETIPRRGYRFIAPVSAAGHAAPPAAPPLPASLGWRNPYTVAAILVVGVGVALGGLFLWREWRRPPADSLAIMPLSNGSTAASLDYLGDGITESIINNLSQLPNLRVMARSTVFHYKGKEIDPRTVGRELGVHSVLSGRVTQVGDQLVISVELMNTSDGTQIWGEHYNRHLADLLAIQEDIAREVAANLQLKLSGELHQRLARRPTVNSDAYQLYLRGLFYFNKRTEDGFVKAADYFHQAIALDPNYGLAYTGLADCYGLQGYDTFPPREYMPKAKAMADKALAIDSQMAEAHTSLAMIKALYEWDWRGAENEFRRAIELNPGYATAHHWYGVHLGAMGRFEESRRELQRALNLDPLSLIVNLNNAYPDHYTHQYDRALNTYRKTIEMDPNFAWAHEDLMLAYEQQGRFREAIEEGVALLRLSGDSAAATAVQRAYAAGGYRVALNRWLDDLKDRGKSHYVSPMKFAQLYSRLGLRDQAMEWLEKAYDQRSGPLVYIAVDPRYDGLRTDPRFQDLVRRMGLH